MNKITPETLDCELIEHYLEACSFQDNLEFRVVRLFNILPQSLIDWLLFINRKSTSK